jgi:DNA-binding CsgD family transcriptional regulator/tetratricopeptide (TPR) repeat protein
MSPVMVGRDEELRRLRDLVGAPQPQVATVAGEPGIGKSRLLQELVSGLPAGTTVLVGQADPGALARPFELLLDAVDGTDVDRAALDAVVDPGRSLVERLRIGLDVVRSLTERGQSVILFEDLHWADSESVALFERIADLPGGRRLLVGTYRPDEITRRHPVAELLVRLERRHSVTHVRVDRLSLAHTSAFLQAVTGSPPPFRAAMALQNRTGGNPFFLEELLKTGGGEHLDLDTLCERPLPWNLAEAVRRQIEDLDPDRRRVLEAAAVLGRKIPFDLLAVVTQTHEDQLILALRDLVERGLLIEIGDDEFSFRHALTREVIADQMLGRQRRRLNELALEELLNTQSADLAQVAHHARGAGRFDDMISAARAGSATYLAIGSAYQALQLAEMGLDELPDDIELLSTAARAGWLAGLLDDAAQHAHRWLRVASTPEDRAAALRLLLRLAWDARRYDDMRSLTDEILDVIRELPREAERARAMATVAQSYMLRGHQAKAIEWADHAITLAQQLRLPDVRMGALVEKGSALIDTPTGVDEGRQLLIEVADEAEKAGEWLIASRAINNLIHDQPPLALTEYADLLERMRAAAEKAGFDSLAVAAYYQGRARLAMHEGDLNAAIAALEEGRRRDRGMLRTARLKDYHGTFLAGLALEAGDLDEADALLPGLTQDYSHGHLSTIGLAFHLACRRRDAGRIEATLGELLAAIETTGPPSPDQRHDLVSAGLFAGQPAARLRPLTGESGGSGGSGGSGDEGGSGGSGGSGDEGGWRPLVQAQLAEAEGLNDEALPGYLAAIEGTELGPAPRGTAHAGAARCLIGIGRMDEARRHVIAAGELLARWSGWRVAEVEALRGRVGLAARGQDRESPLTPREREVATLLAEGLTNAEVARQLFIAPKTAAVHVSNILSKLGLTSRTQVAGWARRQAGQAPDRGSPAP